MSSQPPPYTPEERNIDSVVTRLTNILRPHQEGVPALKAVVKELEFLALLINADVKPELSYVLKNVLSIAKKLTSLSLENVWRFSQDQVAAYCDFLIEIIRRAYDAEQNKSDFIQFAKKHWIITTAGGLLIAGGLVSLGAYFSTYIVATVSGVAVSAADVVVAGSRFALASFNGLTPRTKIIAAAAATAAAVAVTVAIFKKVKENEGSVRLGVLNC